MFGIGCLISINHENGICVNKKQVEPQLKADKSVQYHFDENYTKDNKKIKHCNPGSDSGCDFKEEMKDLKQDMAIMKRELIKSIRDQSKNCRPYQNSVGQWRKKKNNYYN